MTKIALENKEYDWPAMPFIGDLRLLKPVFGFGWGTVLERMGALDSDTPLHMLLDDDEFVEAFIASLWMAKLRAGERDTTIDAIRLLDLSDIVFLVDDEEPPDPTQAPEETLPTERGDANPPAAAPSRPRTSKTSKKPSTRASH